MGISSAWTQCRPPPPPLTGDSLPSQAGKVFIVTGGNNGVGFQLSKILYAKGACVYIASRSEQRAQKAIDTIKTQAPDSSGKLRFLKLDLNDLSTIKGSADAFLAQEQKLDVLWNNAGISQPPSGSKSAQGHEAHMGVNCLGPLLFTTLLLPALRNAAAGNKDADATRIVWTSSMMVDSLAPKGGVALDELDLADPKPDQPRNYAISKAGNWLLAAELDKRERANGIVSLTCNPGNLKTDIWLNAPKLAQILVSPILHDPLYGAYTELWAGLSHEVTAKDGGRYAIPWGRWHPDLRTDLLAALKDEKEGGSGVAARFWSWCVDKTQAFS